MESNHVKIGKKQAAIIGLFFVVCLLVLGLVIYRVYVQRNYLLTSEVECDPSLEVCFKRQCEEDCESEDQSEFYKIQTVSASLISSCNPHDGACPEFICSDTSGCLEMFCNEANLPDGEECTSVEDYQSEVDIQDANEELESTSDPVETDEE